MVPRDLGRIKGRTLLMYPGIWFRAASGRRIYQSWCLTENWLCVKGVCTSCAAVLRSAVTSAFTCYTSSCSSCPPQCATVSAFSAQFILHGHCLHRALTQLSSMCLGLSNSVGGERGVLKGDGSVCINLFCFPKVWVFELLIPSVPRNSFPLNGFYYPAHVWGGFLEALSWNSSWLHKKPVSQFAGCFGSTLMGLILSTTGERALTDNLEDSVPKSCFMYYEPNSAKHYACFWLCLKMNIYLMLWGRRAHESMYYLWVDLVWSPLLPCLFISWAWVGTVFLHLPPCWGTFCMHLKPSIPCLPTPL